MGRKSNKKDIYVCISIAHSLCYTEKLRQHCKTTIVENFFEVLNTHTKEEIRNLVYLELSSTKVTTLDGGSWTEWRSTLELEAIILVEIYIMKCDGKAKIHDEAELLYKGERLLFIKNMALALWCL